MLKITEIFKVQEKGGFKFYYAKVKRRFSRPQLRVVAHQNMIALYDSFWTHTGEQLTSSEMDSFYSALRRHDALKALESEDSKHANN